MFDDTKINTVRFFCFSYSRIIFLLSGRDEPHENHMGITHVVEASTAGQH